MLGWLAAEAPMAGPAMGDLHSIALILMLAVGVGFIGRLLAQPLIVSFIVVGILAGPFVLDLPHDGRTLELLSQIGIAILLFIVGLKLDLTAIRTMGPVALATGLGQILFTSLGGLGLALALGLDWTESAYVAVALTFSSTIIIVKLLSDKREIDALHGRIAIGFLIVQDIAVVLAMIALTAIGAGSATATGGSMALEFVLVACKGLAFVAGILALMRWGLPRFLHIVARSPELLVLFSITWAVGLAVAGDVLGFSKEIGAFLAGISIASTPFRDAIATRLVNLRDFLLLFFFIELGASLDLAEVGSSLGPAAAFSAFVLLGNPLIVMAIMGAMGYRRRTGFLAGLTVAQISEFSLILVGLGASLGHVGDRIVGLVTLVGLVTIALSTYMILYSDRLYGALAPALKMFQRKVPYRESSAEPGPAGPSGGIDVILFGLGEFGAGVARGLLRRGRRVVGVDFDPTRLAQWRDTGMPVAFGDASDPELLAHLPIPQTRWVVLALPDRDTTETLINLLQASEAPPQIAVTARNQNDARRFSAMGVHRVLRPLEDAAELGVDALDAAMHKLPTHSDWPAGLHEVRLESGSIHAGRTVRQLDLRSRTGVHILAVSRAGHTTFDPDGDFVLYPGDLLVLLGDPEQLLEATLKLVEREFGHQGPPDEFAVHTLSLAPGAPWAGRTLANLDIRSRHGVSVISIERDEGRLINPEPTTALAPGDRLTLTGPTDRIAEVQKLLTQPLLQHT